jgi:cytochrome P450
VNRTALRDAAPDVMAPLPLYVICELIGAPPSDRGHNIEPAGQPGRMRSSFVNG